MWSSDSLLVTIEPKATDVKKPVTAFVLALVSLFLAPVLVYAEFIAGILAAMVAAEEANSVPVKVLFFLVVIGIAVLSFIAPIIAIVIGARVRRASRSVATRGTGLALSAIVIAGIVTAGLVLAQVYFWGGCSLDGC